MSRQAKTTYVIPEEYLAFERAAEYKNEYFDGEIYAMVGASRKHNLITLNIGGELRAQLKGRDCEGYVSDMRVRIPTANVYTYPDVVVVCGEPQFEDDYVDTLLNPTLIVEVLSKSTATYDRMEKFSFYRSVASVAECLLVAQTEHRVERYTRRADESWVLTDFRTLEGTIELASIQCSLAMREIYDKVTLA